MIRVLTQSSNEGVMRDGGSDGGGEQAETIVVENRWVSCLVYDDG